MAVAILAEPLIEPLARHHDRGSFSCGEPALDVYLRRQARQDMKRRIATVFVLVGERPEAVAGYYTLSAHAIDARALPDSVRRKLPYYPDIPAILLGRLARDLRYRGQGIGEHLLLDALARAAASSQSVGAFAIVVDAKNDRARSFYEAFGFQPISDRPSRLFLPLQRVARLVPRAT